MSKRNRVKSDLGHQHYKDQDWFIEMGLLLVISIQQDLAHAQFHSIKHLSTKHWMLRQAQLQFKA
jgi:hypothetical protein